MTSAIHIQSTLSTSAMLDVFGISIASGTKESFCTEIMDLASTTASHYVCFVNAHMVIEANKNKEFATIVNSASLNCPDGMPIAKSLQLKIGKRQNRISGPDMLPLLLAACKHQGKSIFLIGGTQEIAEAFIAKATNDFGSGIIAGYISPPFRPITDDENEHIVRSINESDASLILVSLGCPKQERWMYRNKGKIRGCMLGIGYAVPVYAELANRAPKWMREIGLEWLHRLFQSPRALWKRYLVTNTKFLLLALSRGI